jgi:hypothetical protein
MNLYNNKYGILCFCALFIYWAYSYGIDCPCHKNTTCIRVEFYGVQLNHLILFIILGFLFPSYFYTFQGLGMLWEFAEHILDVYPILVIKYIGGCLRYPPSNYNHNKNSIANYTVYRNITKPLNPIDQFFNVKNSKIHGWHGSVAELVPNFFGFLIGSALNRFISGRNKPFSLFYYISK